MNNLSIVKVGGKVLNDEKSLERLLHAFSKVPSPKILVHGGGKAADLTLERMNIVPKMIDGRRITDKVTMDVVTMVYAGLNKSLTAQLTALGVPALGLSGADLLLIESEKRKVAKIDYGYAGDIVKVNSEKLTELIDLGITPVFSPLTCSREGTLFNTNADTIASSLATSISSKFKTDLIYCFEEPGVMKNLDTREIFDLLTPKIYQNAVENKVLSGGIIPKIDNAFDAISKGVAQVVICHSDALENRGKANFKGTVIHA